jgi:hypothetical protein
MTTLRDRQNMEILSVWKNINRQVVGRENKQIAVFPQSILPKQQRDLDVEVGTDKTIEQLSKVFEQKLAALEFYAQNAFLPRFKQAEKEPFSQAFQAVTSTGDVIPLWNQVVRYFQTPGLNNISNDMVKAKVQELKASLNALQYGLKGVINESFTSERMGELLMRRNEPGNTEGAKVLELLRSLSVYTLISRQVDSGDLLLITGDELKSAYKNILQTLSTNQIQILKTVSAENIGFTNAPLRGIPAFEAPSGRIKALQEELGVAFPPDMISRLRNLPVGQLTEQASKISREPSELKEYQALRRLIEERENIGKEIGDINAKLEVLQYEYDKLNRIADVRSTASRLDEKPKRPEGNQGFTPAVGATDEEIAKSRAKANSKALKEYNSKLAKWNKETALNQRLDAEAAEKNKKRDDAMQALSDEANALEKEKADKLRQLNVIIGNILQSSDSISTQVQSLLDTIKPIGIHSKAEQKILETPVEGFGKRMETRGLASMRENYGKESESDESESESESDEDALHFDDRRNDNYYSRPLKV